MSLRDSDRRSRHCTLVAMCMALLAAADVRADEPLSPGSASERVDPTCEIQGGILRHGSRTGRSIALTFDACPTRHVPAFAPGIVATLEREQVPATFFISGRWAEVHPQEFRQLAGVPLFEMALHGYRHRHLSDPATIRAEIEDGRAALVRLAAHSYTLFRPPFGDTPVALAAVARGAGVTPVVWDVVSGDPNHSATAADVERNVLRQVQGGSIIIMHVNGRGIASEAALPTLIARLRERSFRFVTVGDLLHECDAAIAPDSPREPRGDTHE